MVVRGGGEVRCVYISCCWLEAKAAAGGESCIRKLGSRGKPRVALRMNEIQGPGASTAGARCLLANSTHSQQGKQIVSRVARFGSSLLRQSTAYPLPYYRFLLYGVPATPQTRTPAIYAACRNGLPWRELWRTTPD